MNRLLLRGLRRSPRFALTVILVLGLGIGLTTAIGAVFQSALLRDLPVREQDRLVVLWPLGAGGTEISFDNKEYERFRENSRTLADIAGFVHWGAVSAALTLGDRTLPLKQALVSSNFFTVLGASPVVGRLLQPADRMEGDEHVAVISFGTWQRWFGGDPGVVGKRITWLSAGWSFTIVGVAPKGLDYPIGTDIWLPAWAVAPFDLIGRLRPGATVAQAQAELAALLPGYEERTGARSLVGAFAASLPEVIYGDVKPVLLVMAAASGLLLLIACTNVGTLLLLRATDRRREIAIRTALGAPRSHIIRQQAAEVTILCLLGGLLGIAIAAALLRLLTMVPEDLPRIDAAPLGGTTLIVAIAATVLTTILVGMVPLQSLFGNGGGSSLLRSGGGSGIETRKRGRLRNLLVSGQVALALIVLAGASLLSKSLLRLETLPLGYGADHLTMVQVVPPPSLDTSYVPWIRLVDRALPAIKSVPGVVAVSPLLAFPFTGSNTFTTAIEAEGQSSIDGQSGPIVSLDAVGPEFFRTFDIPILRGEGFNGTEGPSTPAVAVVSETIARRLWPGQDPIGKRFQLPGQNMDRTWRTVVGVSGDIHFREFRAPTPMVFVHYQQLSFWQGTIAVRSRGNPSTVRAGIRSAIQSSAPELALWLVRSMDEILSGPLARPRLNAMLLIGFGLAALTLAGSGLYAVVAWGVRQRTRELGIRIAVGATPRRIKRLVLAETLRLIASGSAIGLVLSLAGSRLLSAVLYQVSPTDPFAMLAAVGVLLSFGLFAGWVPAREATRVDPVRALRTE